MNPFCYAAWRTPMPGFWFRIFGYGLYFSRMTPMFSERYGHRKIIKIGDLKIGVLRP